MMFHIFRNDGKKHKYQYQIRNPGPEMSQSKIIGRNHRKVECVNVIVNCLCNNTIVIIYYRIR